MTAVQTWKFEDSAIDQLLSALIVGTLQLIDGALWVFVTVLRFLAGAIAENRRPLLVLAGLIAAAFVLATQPQIAIAVACIAAYAKYGKKLHRVG